MTLQITRDELVMAANTIRGLAMDGVEKAGSGHPGMPMGMADVAAVLFLKHLKYDASDPEWPDRDRFVLSAGHGSMLLYSLLHLAGYGLTLDDLAAFRQWESKTPGHPETEHALGVETTTGPLGQGCGNSAGMALAERMLAARFNTADFTPVDHHTFALCGDGDLMEGVSHEAFSLAGHLALNKLVLLYDCNRITIEGSTDLAYSDNVRRRFQGYNWNVIEIDAHDYDQIDKALRKARRARNAPTIVICHSHIAQGAPNKHDTAAAHGEPLGADEVRAAKRNLGLPEDRAFVVPDRVRAIFAAASAANARRAARWRRMFKKYAAAHPDKAVAWGAFHGDLIPEDLDRRLPAFETGSAIATRAASGKIIQALAAAVPQLVGGSADLAPSTKTLIAGSEGVAAGAFAGRNLHFGVREHGMAAVMNGMALHGGLRVFGATFFVFLDYCRPSVRLAALMKLPVVYVFTHDSFCVGEDGPTHQPVEHLASLRCIPNMTVIRPADAAETAAAWVAALRNQSGPTALILTRQNLAVIDRATHAPAGNLSRGAYTLWQSGPGMPGLILIASGSEVELALKAGKTLAGEANVRVVSMPSRELFERQEAAYRQEVLPRECPRRVVVEAGATFGWDAYAGPSGRVLGINRFGASAPYKTLMEKFGFTADAVVAAARQALRA